MSGRTGTFSLDDLLAAKNVSALDFGVDNIAETIAADLEAHNMLMRDAVLDLAEITLDVQRLSGGSNAGEMKKVDEFGRTPTQKTGLNAQGGFPLDKFAYGLGWTRDWERLRTPNDFAVAAQGGQKAHRVRVLREIKTSVFLSANFSFTDYIAIPKVAFTVRRLWNADSQSIPDGPNGEVFDGATHTHYATSATLTTAALDLLINNVVEHGYGGLVRIVINKANEAAFRALTGFTAYLDPRISLGTQANQVASPRLDITRLDDRAIGIYGAAEIVVKPWGIANYALAYDATSPQKPLAIREAYAGSMNLRLVAEIDAHPLHAQYMDALFGVGVWSRGAAAVLQFNNAGAYADPTIT